MGKYSVLLYLQCIFTMWRKSVNTEDALSYSFFHLFFEVFPGLSKGKLLRRRTTVEGERQQKMLIK